jgi:hypothetical protein
MQASEGFCAAAPCPELRLRDRAMNSNDAHLLRWLDGEGESSYAIPQPYYSEEQLALPAPPPWVVP